MTKEQKKKAIKEAFLRARETLDFYSKKSLEELEKMDTCELSCLGCDFNWLPNSGYEPSEELAKEQIETLAEWFDHRQARKEHYYLVSFKAVGWSFKISYKGKKSKAQIVADIIKEYPQVEGIEPTFKRISKNQY